MINHFIYFAQCAFQAEQMRWKRFSSSIQPIVQCNPFTDGLNSQSSLCIKWIPPQYIQIYMHLTLRFFSLIGIPFSLVSSSFADTHAQTHFIAQLVEKHFNVKTEKKVAMTMNGKNEQYTREMPELFLLQNEWLCCSALGLKWFSSAFLSYFISFIVSGEVLKCHHQFQKGIYQW